MRYRLDRSGIMFVVDLIRHTLTSPNQCYNAVMPQMKVIWQLENLEFAGSWRKKDITAAVYTD